MLPGTMVLVIGFFGILHSWLNAFAEMTRFADRMFYRVSIILTLPVRNPTIKLYNNYTRRFVWSVNKLADPPYKCLFNFAKVCVWSVNKLADPPYKCLVNLQRFVWSVNYFDPPYKCLLNFTKACMECKQACWPSIQMSVKFTKVCEECKKVC